jgi:DNA helicase HerA-like ATPase
MHEADPSRDVRSFAERKKTMNLDQDGKIFVGKSAKPEYLTLALANRHGLVAGATGTGKTVTLQVLAEGLSRAGVSVFAADVKGDLSGISMPGEAKDAFVTRAKDMGFEYETDHFPAVFWDVFGEQGHPMRATVMEIGPLLLSRMLDLNDVQEGIINIAYRVADEDPGLSGLDSKGLVDLKDLRELLSYVSANAKDISARYGNVAVTSIGAVQRQLLVLENQGAAKFLGEPALKLKDFIGTDRDGRGIINILTADKLMQNPRLYATFLLWLLSELFEELPEVGDPDKPKLCFFFDEAHLLFTDAPKALLDKIEQVVRLIRSKGVGVYFVTQNPLDVPDNVLSQLGNRVQHALRAFTPRDQKAVKTAAETFRPNPKLDTFKAIMELGKGEALVSFLEGNGTPSMVERAMIRPPSARLGPVSPEERKAVMDKSPVKGKYDQTVDPESAYEVLRKRISQGADAPAAPVPGQPAPAPGEAAPGGGWLSQVGSIVGTIFGTNAPRGRRLSTGQVVARTVARSVGSEVAREVAKSIGGGTGGRVTGQIIRGTLGGILRSR